MAEFSRATRLLLSSLRKAGAKSLLNDVPDEFFLRDELKAFHWLKTFVYEHSAFPTAKRMRRATGLVSINTGEPPSVYMNDARKRALYNGMLTPYKNMREAMQNRNPDEVLAMCKSILQTSASLDRGNRDGLITLQDALQEVLTDYEIAHANYGIRGIPTGWPYVDNKMDGHQNGDLNTLVGRPGRGKTFLMLYQAWAAFKAGHSVLFVSMEMNAMPIARRIISIDTGFNPDYIRKGRLSTDVKRDLDFAIEETENGIPFNFVAGSFRKSVPAVLSLVEQIMPDILFIDASYLMQPEKHRHGNSGRREVVSDVIEELKQGALDHNRPFVQSVQFNRQAIRPTRRRSGQDEEVRRNPIAHLGLEKIGETDIISQASSVVIGIELGDAPNEATTRWMGFLKGREGEAGYWQINYRFSPVDFSMIPFVAGDSHVDGQEQAPDVDMDWMAG